MNDAQKDLKADYVIANPPFNDSDWSGDLLRNDGRWQYGVPSERAMPILRGCNISSIISHPAGSPLTSSTIFSFFKECGWRARSEAPHLSLWLHLDFLSYWGRTRLATDAVLMGSLSSWRAQSALRLKVSGRTA